jgi:hypothetical protein
MNSTKKTTPIVLERSECCVEIDPEMWAELLLYLSKRGWQPSVPTYYFFAPNLTVSKEDAEGLAIAGQQVLDDALRDPLAIYPVPFDMGKLAELVCFLEDGAFYVRH